MIRLQKYNGEIGQNCAVEVDFTNETVNFSAVGRISLFKLFMIEGLNSVGFFFMFTIIPIWVTSWFLHQEGRIYLFESYFLLLLIVFLANGSKVFSTLWKDKILTKKYTWFPHNMRKRKWLRVNPAAIINKQLVLNESFSNVVLEYRTTEEYSAFLQNITIQETILNKPFQNTWYAIFKFSKKPKKGFMELYWK